MSPVTILIPYFCKIHSNSTSHLWLSLPSAPLASGFQLKFYMDSSSRMCATYPTLIWSMNNNWWRVHMKILITQFSPTSCHFIPLRFNILLNTLFSNTLNLCSSLRVIDLYKMSGNTTVLYILIFNILDRRQFPNKKTNYRFQHSVSIQLQGT
jgi:hypothetical protein